jgi:regulator of nucleoside diphosphate kinase
MPGREIVITSLDQERLTAILNSPVIQNGPDKDRLSDLRAEIERAAVVEPGDVPPDVVTMNSRLVVRDLAADSVHEYTLVYPHEADITQNKISILAPIGMALLGYRKGDVVEWKVPSGTRTLKVEAILYQPESAGDFNS